jgi:hypothetical protein
MEPEVSTPHSQQPNIHPYTESHNIVHASPFHCLKIHFNIIIPSTSRSSELCLSLSFHLQSPVYISPLRAFYMRRQSMRSSVDHKQQHELFQIFSYPFLLLRSTYKVFLLESSQICFHETALRYINKIIILGRTDDASRRL